MFSKKNSSFLVVFALSLLLYISNGVCVKSDNVIMMIPDGCDASVQTLARFVKGEELMVDKMKLSSNKTSMASSVITGSAAAATAFACGHKTTVRFLGVGPRKDDLLTNFKPTADPYVPIASVLEAAKQKGMSVGIVVTSRVTHATPAAYYCHIEDRGLDNEIMEHLVYQDIDVVFGGGAGYLIPENETLKTKFGDTWKGKRVDGENLMKVLLDRKYTFIDNKSDMKKFSGKKVWGLFDDSHLDPDIDRDNFHPTQPSLAEMTEKAIEILSKNPKGFFLMVEGSQVDWAAHANDAVYMTYDFLAFDDAVKVACDFADKNKKTTVIAFPDHNTGALALGHEQSSFPPKYTATSLEALIDPIKNAKMTVQGLLSLLPKEPPPTFEEFVNLMKKEIGEYWEVLRNKDYEKQANEVYQAALSGSNKKTSGLLSKYFTVYGWTTFNHTGEDVPIWTYGVKSNLFEKTIDNTDLAKKVAEILKINLSEISKNLFNDIKVTFPDAVITDTPGNATCELIPGVKIYEGKDIITIKGKDHELKGICVHAPKINTFFIPKEAFTIIPAFALGTRK